ncbi:glutamate receptor 2.6 [Abeliophyllum distichum]|uniref:Glutamate receptor 2.6 n=1 Tax=Abeliophyllum distichum TaxID=126358 RepID=A0ABD1QXU9_9LAMI
MWIFVKPYRWDLWLPILVASIVMGIVLRILEHRVPNTNEESVRPHRERLRMTYWSPITVLAFPERGFLHEIVFLQEQLHINESKLISYSSVEEYHDAMTRESKRGGIDAIFDEIFYMKIFLKKYYSQYKMVGPSYRTDGFGFFFPPDLKYYASIFSPLTVNFSKAILAVTQGPDMTSIERKHFGPRYSSQDPLSSTISLLEIGFIKWLTIF